MTSSAASPPDMSPDHPVWRSGSFVPWNQATVHVGSVGHASVSASFEGIHAYRGGDGGLTVFRLRDHLQRMLNSISWSDLVSPWSLEELVEATVELCRRNDRHDDTYIRPWCFAAGVHREQMVQAGTEVEIVIDVWPFRSKLGTDTTAKAAVSSWTRFGANAMPPQLKAFSNYHNGRLGTNEARARGADWPIFVNQEGHLTESSGANLAIVRDGVLVTPWLASGVLDGITRATVLQLCRESGIPAEARAIGRAELLQAEEVLFIGTAAEVLPITEVDGRTVGQGAAGPVTTRIADLYHDTVRGKARTADGTEQTHAEWRLPVWD
ncbi:aminotransferase class IV [Streptomyces sp. NPDC050388]|uniref:aminotransferase class IV n=1 Tax=Streptomyces sp. NPDC050388 TaxID=3155781 RepID=UPI00342880A3